MNNSAIRFPAFSDCNVTVTQRRNKKEFSIRDDEHMELWGITGDFTEEQIQKIHFIINVNRERGYEAGVAAAQNRIKEALGLPTSDE